MSITRRHNRPHQGASTPTPRPAAHRTRPGARTAQANPNRGAGVRELLRKEVIQPHLPVRLPCYDFVPIASPTFDHSLPRRGWAMGFGCYRLS